MAMAQPRSVQVTGRSTYIISLPKDWARSVGISKGSTVYLEVLADGSLRISPSPSGRREQLSKVIDASKYGDVSSLIREIISHYLAGYSSIRIEYGAGRKDLAERVRDIIESSILGLSVLEGTATSMTFYAVLDPSSMSLDDATSKLVADALHMLEDTLRGMREEDCDLLEGVIRQDQLVDKLYLLIAKQLTIALMNPVNVRDFGLETPAEAPHLFLAAKSVERIADHATIVARNAKDLLLEGGELPDKVVESLEEAIELFREVSSALISPNKEKAERVAKLIERVGRAPSAWEGRYGDPRLYAIVESIGRIFGYSLDIAEAIIDVSTVREAARVLRG